MVEHLLRQGEDGSRIAFTCGCSTCEGTDISQLPPWRKVLYIQQPYADNHTDTATFLADMVLNADVSNPSYWPTVEASLVVGHEVATAAMLVSVFAFRYMDVLTLESLHSLNLSFLVGGLALAAIADIQASRTQSQHESAMNPGTQTAMSRNDPARTPNESVRIRDEPARTQNGPSRTQKGEAVAALVNREKSSSESKASMNGICGDSGHDAPEFCGTQWGQDACAEPGLRRRRGFLKPDLQEGNKGVQGQPRRRANEEATGRAGALWGRVQRWSSCLLACGLLALYILLLSPVLHTLTKSISSDTIWCTTTYLLLLHLYLHDYSYSAALTTTFSSYLALLSALFACVLLASRLPDPGNAFAFISFGLQCFGLLPAILQRVGQASERSHQVVVLLLLLLSLGLVWLLSPLVGLALIALLLFVVLVCPAILVYMHRRYKSSIRGPWDEAKLRLSPSVEAN